MKKLLVTTGIGMALAPDSFTFHTVIHNFLRGSGNDKR